MGLLALATGCGDDPVGPAKGSEIPPRVYLPPSSPQNVLQNLVSAYANRDSVQTAAVYDLAYDGTSTDPSSPTQIPSFSRADEVRHVGRLRRDPSIVSVFIDLGLPSTWQRLPGSGGDPADWAVIQITNSTVRVEDISSATIHSATNNLMEFTFKPTVAAPGDTTWTVVRWTEFAN